MNPTEFLKEIETTYDVASIKINNIQVWPFLRIHYESAYFNKYFLNYPEHENIPISNKINKIKGSFYGLRNLFKNYDYIIFANTGELRLKNGIYINRLAELLFSYLGKERTLLIENPVVENPAASIHTPISKLSMKNILSIYLFTLISFLNPFPLKINLKNGYILKEINEKYDLDINYEKKIKKFKSYNTLFSIFFKIKKPKLIFINIYSALFTQAAIFAARTMGIKTIELQHGVINDKHPAYNVYIPMDKKFFPEYLFVFGNDVRKTFSKNNYFIDKKNVFPIGNMYIEFINKEYELPSIINHLFQECRTRYNKIIVVSSQFTIENDLIEFLKKSALLAIDSLFIFVPRDLSKDYSNFDFPENLIIIKDLDFYQTIKYSDFHATVYSTCALEAPALGIPNILLNIKNLSKENYSHILTNSEVTKFVDTPEEFIFTIHSWSPKSKEEIKQLHKGFYAENHKKCLKNALEKVMEKTVH